MTDPIGNTTFYTVFARVPGQVRPHQLEGEMIETVEEVIAAIDQLPKGWTLWCVFKIAGDIAREDVTGDLAAKAYWSWRCSGNSVLSDDLPQWISEHLPSDLDGGYRASQKDAA